MKKFAKIIDFFEIKISSVLLFVLSIIFGHFKVIILYFLIAFIHELFHLLMALKLNVKIEKFEILPFGASLKIKDIELISSTKQLLIYIAGPMSMLFNLPIIELLKEYEIINHVNYNYLFRYNFLMCFLNLLPIYPLDGHMIIKAILNKVFTFKKASYVSIISSCIFFVLFLIYNLFYFQPMILLFLFVEQIKNIINYKKNYKVFLINKTLNKKERKYKIINDYNMYKDVNNYKFEEDKVLDDKLIALEELKTYI